MINFFKIRNILLLGMVFLLGGVTKLYAQQSGEETVTDSTRQSEALQKKAGEPGPLLVLSPERLAVSQSTISGSILKKMMVPNLSNTLYGQLSGLMVMQGSGEPGNDGAILKMRGIGTYDESTLLCFVDGFQVDYAKNLQQLLPSEIESITLLKDPVTLATFGMRGANGILWIITKRSQAGKPKITAQVASGMQQAININKPLRSYEYASLYNQAVSNDGYFLQGNRYQWAPAYTADQLEAYQNGTGIDVDWYDEVLRKSGVYKDAHVNVSGGSDVVRYNVLLGYMNQSGLFDVRNTETTSNIRLQRFNVRSNLDMKFMKIFEASIDLGGRVESRSYPNNGIGSSLFFDEVLAKYPSSIYPVKDPATDNWSGTTLYPANPVAELKAKGLYTTHDRVLLANFRLKEDLGFITPGLYLSQSVSFNTWTRTNQGKFGDYVRFNNGQPSTTNLDVQVVPGNNNPEQQLTWRQTNLVAGYDRSGTEHAFAGAISFYSSDMIPDGGGDPAKLFYHFLNLSGRFNYMYKSRYILDGALGYSGSDNFSSRNRWGFYPAIAAGWIVSNEPFLKNNDVLSLVKVRASIGATGNETQASRFAYQQYYGNTGGVLVGDNSIDGYPGGAIQLSRLALPEIFAEKSTKYNIGIDVSLLNKLYFTAEYFRDKRTGIVSTNSFIPGYLGFSNRLPLDNIGRMTNQGMEASITYADKKGDFSYQMTAMGTYAKNKIDYQAEIPNQNSFSNSTGHPLGTPMGLVANGFYQLEDFNMDGSLKQGIPLPAFGPVQPGDLKYNDFDGNNVIDNNDKKAIGKPDLPMFYYSFNLDLLYKNFDLSATLQGAAGRSFNLLGATYNQVVPFINNMYNAYPIAQGAWAYYPDQGIDTRSSATFPRLTTQQNLNNYQLSDFWVKKNNFLRMRNIILGYTMPQTITNKWKVEKLRVFVSATNPFTISSLLNQFNFDPETPAGYPAVKTYNAGVTITL